MSDFLQYRTGILSEKRGINNTRKDQMTPLNGTKTHPLTLFALNVLREIAKTPAPVMTINAGVVNRLMRENLAEIVSLPSPYKKHKGGNCDHLQITDEGLKRLKK
jgi:hypothetical protein